MRGLPRIYFKTHADCRPIGHGLPMIFYLRTSVPFISADICVLEETMETTENVIYSEETENKN